jgi:hypothetical protein
MKSFGQRAAGARLERMRASLRWAGEGFRNLHPVLPGLRDNTVPRPTIGEFICGGGRRVVSVRRTHLEFRRHDRKDRVHVAIRWTRWQATDPHRVGGTALS